jgi:antitoxin ParD1/3/4
MAMTDEREGRQVKLEALRAEIQKGLDSGPAEKVDIRDMVGRIKREGRERLAAKKRTNGE